MRIAVAGGTGVVGRHVVAAAGAAGHEAVVLARSTGANVSTGAGLAESLTGVDALIDVTNATAATARAARAFFETATRNLLAAEAAAGVRHHVALSIVGIDDIDAGYYAGKLAQERAIAAGSMPYTIARAAQFHEFVEQTLARVKGPVAVMPKALIRPVAAREVGTYLVGVAEREPSRRAVDIVGPRDERLAELARRLLAYDGVKRRVVETPLPGRFGKGMASGVLRGADPRRQGAVTFDEWLASDDHTPA